MKKLVIILLSLFLFSIWVSAQERYSLEDCYRVALNNNLQIKRADNGIRVANIDKKAAQYQLLPSLSYGMQHSLSLGKNIDPVTNNFVNEMFSGGTFGSNIQLKIFSGFSALYSMRQSQYLVEQSVYAKKKVELDVLQQVTLAYAKLLYSKERSAIVRSSLSKTAKELEITSEKARLGKISRSEVYALNARKSTEEAELVNTQNDSVAALQELKQLICLSYKDEIKIELIDTTMLSNIMATQISSSDFIASVLSKHPAIQQAKTEEQVTCITHKIAKSSLLPAISIGVNLASNYKIGQLNRYGQKIPFPDQINNNFGQSVSISLRVPVFSQFGIKNRIKKEEIAIANAEFATREIENAIVSNTLQLINDISLAKHKYLASLTALQQNRALYDIYEEKYKLGQVSALELITAKDFLDTSDSKCLQAKIDLFFRHRLLMLLK